LSRLYGGTLGTLGNYRGGCKCTGIYRNRWFGLAYLSPSKQVDDITMYHNSIYYDTNIQHNQAVSYTPV